MKLFYCTQCAAQVYFDNTVCGACQANLLFVPSELSMVATQNGADGAFAAISPQGAALKPCAQRFSAAQCNWALPALVQAPAQEQAQEQMQEQAQSTSAAAVQETNCISCQLTRWSTSAPIAENALRWQLAEAAKRRLLFTMLSLGLPFAPKQSDSDVNGLAFEWQVPAPDTPVMTGHADGVITLNLLEADDDHREVARVAFSEPLRSVLGHLRHELAHHLQQRFLIAPELLTDFRALFGDERADYKQALQSHYTNGPPADVSQRFITAYASAHPWEDWAETCAHYLLVVDAVETATAWGLRLDASVGLLQSGTQHARSLDANLAANQAASTTGAMAMSTEDLVFGHWLPVARFLNAMARSLGSRDSYPFVLPTDVLNKLRFVQRVLDLATTRLVPVLAVA
jgi:hypothetical protein